VAFALRYARKAKAHQSEVSLSRFCSNDIGLWTLDSIMSDREEFLTAKQLAEILQVSESTVRRLAQKRRIPSVRLTPRIIRFHLDAVREALDVPRVSSPHHVQTDDAQLSFEDLLSS